MTDVVLIHQKNKDGVPVLTFGETKHLSWYRGYRMQVSANLLGDGNHGSSSSTLAHELLDAGSDTYKKIVVLAHIYQATMSYNGFWSAVRKNPIELDKFVGETISLDNRFPKLFNYTDIMDLVQEGRKTLDETVNSFIVGSRVEDVIKVDFNFNYVALTNLSDNKTYHVDLTKLPETTLDFSTLLRNCLVLLAIKAGINTYTVPLDLYTGNSLKGIALNEDEEDTPRFTELDEALFHFKSLA